MFQRLLMLAIALIAGTALAIEVRSGDTLAITSPTAGTMIGVGSVQEGRLSLHLVESFDGFARMAVRSTDGVTVTYDVFVDARGIQVITGSTVQDLRSALEATGITVSVQGVDAEAVRNAAASFDGGRDDDVDDGDDGADDDGRDGDDDGRDDDHDEGDDGDEGADDDDDDDSGDSDDSDDDDDDSDDDEGDDDDSDD